jgi:hypothetical protein
VITSFIIHSVEEKARPREDGTGIEFHDLSDAASAIYTKQSNGGFADLRESAALMNG